MRDEHMKPEDYLKQLKDCKNGCKRKHLRLKTGWCGDLYVACAKCFMSYGVGFTPDEAIKKWNEELESEELDKTYFKEG